MKIINLNAKALVILHWDKFEEILKDLPIESLVRILKESGCSEKDLHEMPAEYLISKIFSEYEEQAD